MASSGSAGGPVTGQRRTLVEQVRQSWLTVVIVALTSMLLGWAAGFSYVQLRFVGVSGSPSETVTRYLNAIAANDAVAALAELADHPADSSLLTDEVLRAAHVDRPMSRIEVTDTNSTRVPATFTLGSESISITIPVQVVAGEFKVDAAAVPTADVTQARTLGVPILIGGRTTTSDKPALFPGIYPVTSGNGSLALAPLTTLNATKPGEVARVADVRLELTTAGTASTQNAIRTSLTQCAGQTVVAPSGCPFRYDTAGQTIKPGSVRWVNIADPGGLATITLREGGTAVAAVSGTVRFFATRVDAAGREDAVTQDITYRSTASLDLLTESAALEWST